MSKRWTFNLQENKKADGLMPPGMVPEAEAKAVRQTVFTLNGAKLVSRLSSRDVKGLLRNNWKSLG